MHIREADTEGAVTVGWGLTVGVIALEAGDAPQVLRCLAGQGAVAVPLRGGLPLPDMAIALIGADPAGGIAAAERIGRAALGARDVPLVILSRDCAEQVIPPDLRRAPVVLRMPLSAVSARVLLEHVALKRKGAHRQAARP